MKRAILFITAILLLCGCGDETFVTNVYAPERVEIGCNEEFVPLEYSDAVYDYENVGYRLVADLYVATITSRIILPTGAEYNGATVKVFNYKFPPNTRLPTNTLVMAEGGDPIVGTAGGLVSIQGEIATFVAIPSYNGFKVKWILINKQKG